MSIQQTAKYKYYFQRPFMFTWWVSLSYKYYFQILLVFFWMIGFYYILFKNLSPLTVILVFNLLQQFSAFVLWSRSARCMGSSYYLHNSLILLTYPWQFALLYWICEIYDTCCKILNAAYNEYTIICKILLMYM